MWVIILQVHQNEVQSTVFAQVDAVESQHKPQYVEVEGCEEKAMGIVYLTVKVTPHNVMHPILILVPVYLHIDPRHFIFPLLFGVLLALLEVLGVVEREQEGVIALKVNP